LEEWVVLDLDPVVSAFAQSVAQQFHTNWLARASLKNALAVAQQ
jgi:hypothetical protein